jgi:iron(III) transport system ATP-binding protein
MQLTLDQVSVRLGAASTLIVDRVSLDLKRGEIGVLMGPSGCGKTTLIRAIAGLEAVAQGRIVLHQRSLSGPGLHLPPAQRGLGMVFQDYALFPHLSVADNVGFGLNRWQASARQARVQEVLAQVQLHELAQRMPHQLSGGQQQRVALARALAPQPELLLMDEPFSNLDRSLRESLSIELRDLLKAAGTTVLIVTHDLDEAFALGDRVGVMAGGRLLQWDEPRTLYQRPRSVFVAEFTGRSAWLQASGLGPGRVSTALGEVQTPDEHPVGQACQVLLRADDVLIDAQSPHRAELVQQVFRGHHQILSLRLSDGQTLMAHAPLNSEHVLGQSLGLRLREAPMTVLPTANSAQAV